MSGAADRSASSGVGPTLGPRLAGKPGESKGTEETQSRRSEALSVSTPLLAKAPQAVFEIRCGAMFYVV